MKRILSFIAVMLLALTLVACKKTDDPAQAKLDEVYEGLEGVITDPSSITGNFQLPVKFQHGVTGTWVSNEPGVVSIGTPGENTVVVTVNRPPKGSGNTTVKLSIELKIDAENSDDILTRTWSQDLTIIESATEDLNIETIADILALADDKYDPADKADKVSVTLEEVTVFAKGDVAFVYDGTGIIQVFGGAAKDLEVGKVYKLSGLLEWYFGIWEIIDSTAEEVKTATPKMPEKTEITDISKQILDMNTAGIWEAAAGTAKDGNMEPIYATVTGKVHIRPELNASDNYNTYIIGSEVDAATWKPGETGKPANGFMFYYGTSDFSYVRSFNTFEVTMDVVIYTYRSNNHAYAAYYVGGKEGIVLGEITDEQAVALEIASFNLPIEVLETKVKALDLTTTADAKYETTIKWELVNEEHKDIVDVDNGNVEIPAEGQTEVKIKVTVTKGDETDSKVFTLHIGAAPTLTVEEAKEFPKGRTFNLKGTITGTSGNRALTIEDETGAMVLYGKNLDEFEEKDKLVYGNVVTVTGKKDVYNGLHQMSGYKVTKVETETATVDPLVLDELDLTELEEQQSRLVTLNNVLVTKVDVDDFGSVTMTFTRADGQTIDFKWDNRVVVKDNKLADFKVGDLVNIVAAPLSWNKGPIIGFDRVSQVVKLDNAALAKQVKDFSEYKLTKAAFEEAGTITLEDKISGLDVTWNFVRNSDDNAHINLETGAVTVPASGQLVIRLVVTIEIESIEYSRIVEVTLGKPKPVELVHEFDLSTATTEGTANSYVTSPTDAVVLDKANKDAEFTFVRYAANISTQAEVGTGIVLGLRNGNNWESPYLSTKNKVTKLQQIDLTIGNWTADASFNIDYADAINIEISEDGTNWTVVKNLKPEWNTERSALNSFSVNINNPESKDLFVRIHVVSAGTQSGNNLRLIVREIKLYTEKSE